MKSRCIILFEGSIKAKATLKTCNDIINVLIDKNHQKPSSKVKIPTVIVGENGSELVQ